MGAGPNVSHPGFTFGSNGFHSDDLGHGCVLLGTVDFQHFLNALDAVSYTHLTLPTTPGVGM